MKIFKTQEEYDTIVSEAIEKAKKLSKEDEEVFVQIFVDNANGEQYQFSLDNDGKHIVKSKTKMDSDGVPELDEDGKEIIEVEEGVCYLAFHKEPNIYTQIKCLDLISIKKYFEAGFMMFDVCFMSNESDSIFKNKKAYKSGLCSMMASSLELRMPILKKN